jgi:NAD(P)-dependent dehydrogenase (short-subunit alcohol dehydrogenase family)
MNSEKVALVTGCSSGFGRAIAETLARRNCHVFATVREIQGRNRKAAGDLVALAKQESLPLQVLELDVTSETSVQSAVDAAQSEAGRIDVLVNNAGDSLLGLLEASTVEQTQRIFDTNFFGVVRMNRAVLPLMRRRGKGLLLHISSGFGRIAMAGMGMYSASKFAVEAIAEAYCYELASQGIDSIIVEPGPYATALTYRMERAADESRTSTYGEAKEIPAKLYADLCAAKGDPQEVADAVLHLIETPAGRRPLRTTVGFPQEMFQRLNESSEQVLRGLLHHIGLAPLTEFQSRASGTD